MYAVNAWRNTGFNTVNLPDSPDKLLLEKSKAFYAIDCVQNRFLTSVQIRATLEEAIGIDYIALIEGDINDPSVILNYPQNAVFYVVTSIDMVSKDVCRLGVVEDFITTAGGIEKVSFNAGMIIRRSITNEEIRLHTKLSDVDDPYLQCNNTPNIIAGYVDMDKYGNNLNEGGGTLIVESTINLDSDSSGYRTTNYSTGDYSVQTPTANPVDDITHYVIRADRRSSFFDSEAKFVHADLANTLFTRSYGFGLGEAYDHSSPLFDYLAKLRARGLENAIVSSYFLPSLFGSVKYVTGSHSIERVYGYFASEEEGNHIGCAYSGIIPGSVSLGEDPLGNNILPNENGTVYDRIFMGSNNLYTLMSPNGSTISARPEELSDAFTKVISGHNTGNDLGPGIVMLSDPRSTGRVYYAFAGYHSDNGLGLIASNYVDPRFWQYCISGPQWRQVALQFRGASGSDIIKQKYDLHSSTREANFGIQAMNANFAERQAALNYSQASNPLYRNAGLLGGLGATPGFNYNISNVTQDYGGSYTMSNMAVSPANAILGAIGMSAGSLQSGMHSAYSEQGALLNLRQAETYGTALNSLQSAQRNEELYSLGVQLGLATPTIAFGGDADTMRDVTSGRAVMFKTQPKLDDLKRFNHILNRFGHIVNEPLDTSLAFKSWEGDDQYDREYNYAASRQGYRYVFTRPSDTFEYVQFSGAQIGLTSRLMSPSEKEGIAKQLSGGIRFWHQAIIKDWNDTVLLTPESNFPTISQH